MTVKNNFEISLDKFIDFALYDKKKGYYMQKDPFGLKGDFITCLLYTSPSPRDRH